MLVGLLPFAEFGLAEEIGASGILAAVAAGMTASRLSLLERAHLSARIPTGITWNVVSFCLNGIIFVLLGLQLPGIIGSGPSGINLLTSNNRFGVADEILELTAILIGLRLVWVLASLLLGRLAKRSEGGENWRVIAASSIAGVRGAVTLAGALSIPLLMSDGSPFPDRDLAITLAVGIILASMLIAAIGLPLLLRGVPADRENAHAELKKARLAAVQSAMAAVDSGGNGGGPREAALLAVYQERFASLNDENSGGHDEVWRDLHRTALHAEREAVQSLRMKNEIDDVLARQLLSELDLLEAALHHRPFRLAVSAQDAVSE